jgi:hypothetical protein
MVYWHRGVLAVAAASANARERGGDNAGLNNIDRDIDR